MNSGNVIKGVAPRAGDAPARGAVSLVLKRRVIEARAEAERIRGEAEHYAAEVRARAEQDAAELQERTRHETKEAALAELTALLAEARGRRDGALVEVERDVLRLSVRIAEKIIGREIRDDPGTLADIVATALRHARQHQTLVVRVNPADLPIVEARSEQFDAGRHARFIDFVPDPHVASGGCVIESEAGTVDATLETQLRVLERALLARTGGS